MPRNRAHPETLDILVLDGHWGPALRVAQALALTRCWRIHVLAFADQLEVPIHRSWHLVSFRNMSSPASEGELLDAIEATASAVGARVILPLGEATTLLCIRHRARLEKVARLPPLADAATFSAAVDKASLAGDLQSHGLPAPRTWVHTEGAPLPATPPGLSYPLMVKPSRGEFGLGIECAHDEADFHRIVSSLGPGARFVVQEVVPGQDVDCSVLAADGEILAYTIQQAAAPPARAFAPATRLEFVHDEQVLALVRRLVGALGWSGIAHIDLRREADSGRPLILEINARIWASLLASIAAGVNFPDLMGRAALGLTLPPAAQQAVRYNAHGLGFKPVLRGLRRQPDGFKFSETNLPFVLGDPLPVLVQEFTTRMKRLGRAGRQD